MPLSLQPAPMTTITQRLRAYFAAPDAASGLPERVKELVRVQDWQSERLVGVMQLAIGLLLGALYLAAPRPQDAGMQLLAPVPIAVAAYVAFSLVRLRLTLLKALPRWFVTLSILADTCLLVVLIWSFHFDYGQPAAFSLKVPAFLYFFVFIALRALRFDHRYVLTSGLFAALGWTVLTFAALCASDEGTITHSFTAYMTGNRILIGAEIEKIVALLTVTALLSIGVRRAQQTLVTAVREEAAGREIKRFLSRGVAEAIAGSEMLVAPGQAAERDAAILMLDIRGFTRFSTTASPKAVVDMLTSFHTRIVPIIRGNHGVIDKFLGDGVMATFGAVQPSATAAADALRALDAVMIEAEAWKEWLRTQGFAVPLEVNGAVAAGPVVFATLGNEDRLEFTVIGEAVNLAAKLEKHNKDAKTRALCPASVHAAAIAQGYRPPNDVRPLPASHVAGVPEPLDLVVLAP